MEVAFSLLLFHVISFTVASMLESGLEWATKKRRMSFLSTLYIKMCMFKKYTQCKFLRWFHQPYLLQIHVNRLKKLNSQPFILELLLQCPWIVESFHHCDQPWLLLIFISISFIFMFVWRFVFFLCKIDLESLIDRRD